MPRDGTLARFYRGRVALVTGAGSGIGAAFVRTLLDAGARVVATDRDANRLGALLDQARGSDRHGALACAALDVTDAAQFARVVAEHGVPDVLINNAGIGLAGELRDTSLEDWRRVFAVNTMGVVHGIDAVYGGMVERGAGTIVNVASGAGLLPRPGMVAYASSKSAVLGLSLSLHAEARAYGVSVSVVCPGYVATDIMNATDYRSVDGAGLQASIPIRPMSAERCAELALLGAARGQALIPVSGATRVEWWLSRISPSLTLRIAGFRARKFRDHRTI